MTQVVLINLRSYPPNNIGRAAGSLAIKTIEMGLRERGISTVTTYPPESVYFEVEKIRRDLKRMVGQDERAVFALSLTTDDYSGLPAASRVLREEFPQATIVVGGPHFRREPGLVDREDQTALDPVELVLKGGIADAVVVGHAGPFVEWLAGSESLAKFSQPGFFRLVNGEVVGSGWGSYPHLSHPPFTVSPYGSRVELLLDDSCSNACGICSVNRRSLGFTPEQAEQTMAEIHSLPNVRVIQFHDSNPFHPTRFPFYRDLLKKRETGSRVISKLGLMDPSLLLLPEAAKILKDLFSCGFNGFFWGREVTAEASARRLGINFEGQPKDRARLDAERKAMRQVIRDLKRKTTPQPHQITISYILDPFAEQREIMQMIDEMEAFEKMSETGVRVQTHFFALCPYPGTPIRRKYFKYIWQPQDHTHLSTFSNAWRYSIGPSSVLISRLLEEQTTRETFYLLARHATTMRPRKEYFDMLRRTVEATFKERNIPAENEYRERYLPTSVADELGTFFLID